MIVHEVQELTEETAKLVFLQVRGLSGSGCSTAVEHMPHEVKG